VQDPTERGEERGEAPRVPEDWFLPAVYLMLERQRARVVRLAPPPDPAALRRNLVGGSVGNVLEWYDFAVFGYFAPVIGRQFFPAEDEAASLLSAFAVFAAAYFARPVGGLLFGHIGDRYGRKTALQLSVLLMAVPTFLVGLLPTTASIGLAATLLLVLLRLAQGVSVGGELIGSMAFLAEIAPRSRRGYFASWATSSSIAGITLGSLVAAVLGATLDPVALEAWGWRVPFLAGIGIGWFGLWMRRGLQETGEFERLAARGQVGRLPAVEAVLEHPGQIVQTAALVSLSGGGFYVLFVWWPTFLDQLLQPPVPHALVTNTISMVVLVALVPLTGRLSDAVGRKPLLIVGALGVVLLAAPLFHLVDHGSAVSALAAQLVFAAVMSLFLGPIPATLTELFPARTRTSGVAIGYNASLSLLGGTAPFVATWLLETFRTPVAPATYLALLAAVSLVAAAFLPAGPAPRAGPEPEPESNELLLDAAS